MLDPRHPGPDYALRWPVELLVHEAKPLATAGARSQPSWSEQVELLLEEAFVSDLPGIDFRAGDFVLVPAVQPSSKLEAAVRLSEVANELHQSRQEQFLHQLIRSAPNLNENTSSRPYYPVRNHHATSAAGPTPPQPDVAGAKRDWLAVAMDLFNQGYLDHAVPRPCVDDTGPIRQQYDELDDVFAEKLGIKRLWHSTAEDLAEDDFFGMVEVVHDLVARPRRRWLHDHNNCGWHYSAFATHPAQILYRWTVNKLLRRHGIDLELAKSGEDVGRLIHIPADGRADLVTRLARPGATTGPAGDAVAHATSLFRSRTATREDKRSACIALAGVLESRRPLLKAHLLSRDEGALFQIANQFDVRHRAADQHSDYDDAYLDWLFWWYLATVDLTNQLISRQASGADRV